MHKFLSLAFCLLVLVCFYYSPDTQANKSSLQSSAKPTVVAIKKPVVKGMLTPENFQDSIQALYNTIGLEKSGLSFDVFKKGIAGYHTLRYEGALGEKPLLTIIDFSQPSTSKRFYTIDLEKQAIWYHTYVAHGRNTGENLAKSFSNKPHSNQSSLGFYVTGETYVGSKGYSLRLDGMEKTFNDNIRQRAVVIHSAEYVSENWIKRYGRLGRSQGCPALPPALNKEIINTIKNKTAIFTYYPDENYLAVSKYLNMDNLMEILAKNASVKKVFKQI